MKNFKSHVKKNKGMTYVELIVVLSIFAIMSSLVIFNYGKFQAQVDIKNLASDIASQIAQAQKSALNGMLPPALPVTQPASPTTWKPSYGVYFDTTRNQDFIYFVDANSNGLFDGLSCSGECIRDVSITKGNYISGLSVFYTSNPNTPVSATNVTFTFTRPSSGMSMAVNGTPVASSTVVFAQVVITSPNGVTSSINIYPSGRIEIQ